MSHGDPTSPGTALTAAPQEMLAAETSRAVAARLKEGIDTLASGEVTVSLRDGARLVVAAPEGGDSPAELYRSGPTDSYINHGLDTSTLVVFIKQGDEVAGRVTAVLPQPIAEETIATIESLARVAAVRILQLESAARFEALITHEREFLDRFAHDMKTPLTAILGMAQTLQRQDRLTPELRTEFLERIEASSRDLERILEEGRAQLKAKSASLSLAVEECDLHPMLADAVRHARDGIAVTIENVTGAPCVVANPAMLAGVLERVVAHSSARAASGMRVEVGRSGEWVEIKVEDDGVLADESVYADDFWFRGRLATVGQTRGDPLELVGPARDLRVMGGKMAFETAGGRLRIILVLPAASTLASGD